MISMLTHKWSIPMALTIKTERTAQRELHGLKPKREEPTKVYRLTPARWPKHFIRHEKYDLH